MRADGFFSANGGECWFIENELTFFKWIISRVPSHILYLLHLPQPLQLRSLVLFLTFLTFAPLSSHTYTHTSKHPNTRSLTSDKLWHNSILRVFPWQQKVTKALMRVDWIIDIIELWKGFPLMNMNILAVVWLCSVYLERIRVSAGICTFFEGNELSIMLYEFNQFSWITAFHSNGNWNSLEEICARSNISQFE